VWALAGTDNGFVAMNLRLSYKAGTFSLTIIGFSSMTMLFGVIGQGTLPRCQESVAKTSRMNTSDHRVMFVLEIS
jgi:hypothetical protein